MTSRADPHTLETLPTEILLEILSYLKPTQLVTVQQVSRYFLSICRDNNLWKQLCFAEPTHRRLRHLFAQMNPQLAELARAFLATPSMQTHSSLFAPANHLAEAHTPGTTSPAGRRAAGGIYEVNAPSEGAARPVPYYNQEERRRALLARWEPTYPGEKVNWYQEYIHRHAPCSVSWFEQARYGHRDDNLHHEATGLGLLYDDRGLADKLVAPLEDGSVGIWDASGTSGRQGSIIARSPLGLLPNQGPELGYAARLNWSKALMTETGVVECVSIDSKRKQGFFGVGTVLNEVDLQTLQIISRTPYPFPITALSEASHPTPLTVGTNWTLHLHDTRRPPKFTAPAARVELIGGSPEASLSRLDNFDFGGHVSLSQPGALSILHLPETSGGNGDIWVGGRFTSLLNYDRRFFPRLRGTLHSGGRLSSLTSLPWHFIPSETRYSIHSRPFRELKDTPGHTMIAAGVYKGKGSLELYSLSSNPLHSATSSGSSRKAAHTYYHNRQTASSSKLLSVTTHGCKIVFSDGNGVLKWVDRDGSTPIPYLNINNFSTTRDSPYFARLDGLEGDIVQKILPTIHQSVRASASSFDPPLGSDNLAFWTGEGHLGLVGFGHEPLFKVDDFLERDLADEERMQRLEELEYASQMRQALERQAMEERWLRGYGLDPAVGRM